MGYLCPWLQKGQIQGLGAPDVEFFFTFSLLLEQHINASGHQSPPTPCEPHLHGVVVGALVVSDLEEGLGVSEWEQHCLLKAVSRKGC